MNPGAGSPAQRTPHWFAAGALLITLVALALRFIYLVGADSPVQIAGDINDYVRYAWNLGQHGVYSSARISDVAPAPDSFRPPGYPLFLLLAMALADFSPSWMRWAQTLQILLSGATVLLTMLLGRQWLGPAVALAAGAVLAIWPHHIVFASTLLSETVYGFWAMLALWLTAAAWRRHSFWLAVAAGLAFGYAALINTLILLFPLVVAALALLRKRPRPALLLLAGFLAVSAAWWAASPAVESGSQSNAHRARMNLVQGSWPHYHAAWRARHHHESAAQVMAEINREVVLMADSPERALDEIGLRMARDPWGYARWYVLEKPYLLWDWDVQLGWGGFHFLPVRSSPFDRQPVFKATAASIKLANPWIFALAALAAAFSLVGWLPGSRLPFAYVLVSAFVIYVTGLHVVLQAEPRYSIPYRPEQILLAVTGLAVLARTMNSAGRWLRGQRTAGAGKPRPPWRNTCFLKFTE